MKLNIQLISLATAIALSPPIAAQVPNTLLNSIPGPVSVQDNTQMGYSVAVDGGYTVVAIPLDDTSADDSGIVKVFDTATGALLFVLTNPSPAINEQFGLSVAISGTRVVVGCHWDDTGAADAGSAYVYDLAGGTPTVPMATLNNPVPAANDHFGVSVAISGTILVVGAFEDDTGASNAGSAYVYDLSGATPTVPVATLNNPDPTTGDQFGISVAISGTRIVVGAYFDDTGATDAGSAYVYDLGNGAPTVPVATLNNPSPVASDRFGISVVVSGLRVVVGSYLDDTGATDAGCAYVYDLSSGTPTVPVATINNPGPAAGDQFGRFIAIDGTRLVVGAYNDDTGAANAGSVYIYDLSSGAPTIPTATLNNPNPATNDSFGWSVSISGMRAVVGAFQDDTLGANVGSAYIYDFGSGTPTIPAIILNHSPGPSVKDRFGGSIAMSGSLVAIGAPQDDSGTRNAGSVYVYNLSSGTPTVPVFNLKNPSPATDDSFGWSVAMSGSKVVVGVFGDDIGAAFDAGSAYVFDLSSGTPTVPVAMLSSPVPDAGANFGNSVAMSGSLVVVGAYDYDAATPLEGRAYVFDLNSATPTVPVITLSKPSPLSGDKFGSSVAISGTRVVVGAYLDDTGATDGGSAYVYDLTSGTPAVPVAMLNNPDPSVNDLFGHSVAIAGTRIVVGAPFDDAGASDAGSAYVYDLTSATPSVPVVTLYNPGPALGDNFGWSVAIAGAQVVVGAYNDDTGATNAGSAYVYDLSSGTPTVPVATLNNPGPAVTDQFGSSVAVDATNVGIGTPGDDTVGIDKGYAYIFGPAPPPEIAVEVQPSNSNVNDGGSHDFGTVVTGSTLNVTFTVKNTGLGDLFLNGTPRVAVSGPHAGMFSVTSQPVSPVGALTGTTSFTVQFLPTSGGVKTAALSIPNNDDNEEAPFDINLTGRALAFTDDTDADGLNDASEFQMAALGYDWQVSQPALVNTLYSNANGAGIYNQTQYDTNRTAGQNDVINAPNTYSLYTLGQVQALNVGTPLIVRNPTTGVFTLTIGVEKSTTLQPLSFQPFSMTTAPGAVRTFNDEGKLEFQFTVPDNAAFFQLRSQ